MNERVPAAPFQQWLNERYDKLAQEPALYPNQHSDAAIRLCMEIGWTRAAASRRLFRYRHGLTDGSRGSGASRHTVSSPTDTYSRKIVENALHHAGVDFYDIYSDYAYERDISLEPVSWCPECREHVTPINGECPWDGQSLNEQLVAT